jgi:hypothetical protein
MADTIFPNDIPSKATPVSADVFMIADSADSNKIKKVTWGSLPSAAAATWGGITGTLASQTDLNTALGLKQDATVEKSADFTASLHGYYITTNTCTVTDPGTPSQGHEFTVLVWNGTATVGGTAYSAKGTLLRRVYHSGSWTTEVYKDAATFATAGAATSSGLTMSTAKLLGRSTAGTGALEEITLGTNLSFTGTTLNATGGGSGGFLELAIADYQGPAVIGQLGRYTATRTGTLGSIRLVSDTLPVGSNVIAELRKNSTTSGNVLSATLQVTTTESATNGQYIGTTVSTFSSTAIAAGDVFYVVLTSVGSTTPGTNVRALLYTT